MGVFLVMFEIFWKDMTVKLRKNNNIFIPKKGVFRYIFKRWTYA